jgi:uncharacterized protein (DUF2062 family)
LKAFFAKKVRQPLTDLLRQGLTPEKLACAMALGLTIGMLPCPWGPTILCAIAAHLLRINHVAIQVANYLAWPFQIALIIPFFWIGQKLFPFGEPLSLENLSFSSLQQPLDSLGLFLAADVKAVVAWLLLSPLLYLFVYFLAIPIFTRLMKKHPATAST